jgi:hypothetical protein
VISITKLVELTELKPIPPGAKIRYSSAASTHDGIDRLAGLGVLYAGERERLLRVLDELRA